VIAPRLILLDLDGTLLGADGRVSDRNAAALRRAADAGARVVVATARPVRWLAAPLASIPSTVAVCSNGGVVVDLATGVVLHSHVIDAARLLDLADRLRSRGVLVAFAVEGLPELGMLAEEHYVPSHAEEIPRRLLADLFTVPIVKGLIRGASEDLRRVVELLETEYADVLAATSSGETGLLEVSLAGISKGAVIARLAAGWGVTAEESIAFGDAPNDVEMLLWAGQSVAVANADPAVRAIATEIGAHHDDHAVARVLERWY
jgi:Cof subfamily protein (haloacid dehalogenase superfamily)